MGRRLPRATTGALALGACLLAAGRLGGSEVVVRSARPLGPYLEVHLAGGTERSVLLPATPLCAAIARPEASLRWRSRGFPGRVEAIAGGEASNAGAEATDDASAAGAGDADAASCDAAGILDLAAWRDRRPRPDGPPVPRTTARWTVIHRDGRRALLRGRFPLAGLVGMPGGYDLVAVVADDPACAPLLDAEEGSLEYRASGRVAYRLSAGGARCEVLGFARPPPSAP